MDKTCIDRKLLAIDATFNDEVLREIFGIDHAYTLFLTVGRRRRDNMVDLTMETLTNKVAAESTLFAVQPPVPAVGDTPDLSGDHLDQRAGKRDEVAVVRAILWF